MLVLSLLCRVIIDVKITWFSSVHWLQGGRYGDTWSRLSLYQDQDISPFTIFTDPFMAVPPATQADPFTKVTCKTERSMVNAEKKQNTATGHFLWLGWSSLHSYYIRVLSDVWIALGEKGVYRSITTRLESAHLPQVAREQCLYTGESSFTLVWCSQLYGT